MFNRIFHFFVLSCLMVGLFASQPPTPVRAAGVIYVNDNAAGSNNGSSWANAYTSLQPALVTASSGTQIWVAAGTYKPTSNTDRTISFMLKNEVEVYGGFAGTETLLSQRDPATNISILSGDIGVVGDTSDNSYQVVNGGGTDNTAVLDGFTITAGNANGTNPYNGGGGMYNQSGNPTISNVIFSGNSASVYGGGMYSWNSSLALTNVTFVGNYVTDTTLGFGGGMYNLGSSTLTNVTFDGNSAKYGGGLYTTIGSPTLTDVVFKNNTAEHGGGMHSYNNSFPNLTNVTFNNNSSSAGGGGMYSSGNGGATLTDVTFINNATTGGGGGMSNNSGSNSTLTNVTFSGNFAGVTGGGMYNANSNPDLNDVIFSGNSANDSGGGMFNITNSSPTLTGVTFSGNTAIHGGGMYNWNSSNPSMMNVTFSGNSATTGGGMYNSGNSNPSMMNVTFSGNSATTGGGITNISNSNPVIINSILYNNTGGELSNSSSTPVITYSIVQGGYSGTGNLDADPLLGALGNNGGFTQTMALGFGSPAINAGTNTNCPATDQRGITRPHGGKCDMGAFEFEKPFVVSVTRLDPNPAGASSTVHFLITFSDIVTAVDANDMTLTTTGSIENASITNINNANDISYEVAVFTGTGSGSIRLDIGVDQDAILDEHNHPLASGFTDGEVYTVENLSTSMITSTALQDGWILESSETSGKGGTKNNSASTLFVGDDAANKQYRAILSFDTTLPTNAVITSVTLKFKYAGKSGTLPFSTHGKLVVDIRIGPFGNNASLQLGDFKAGASKNSLFALTNNKVNGWYIKAFSPSQFQYINTNGITQFRLRFTKDDNNDFGADFLKLYSGNAGTANRPQLIIEYYVP